MRKLFTITHYEFKMQLKRIAAWGILIFATAVALIDNFPSDSNLARLEFLSQPSYFVYRTMCLDALVIVFGLMFLMSNRVSIDHKSDVKALIMASPISKGQYVFGKLMGNFLYTFTLLTMFLTLNTMIYYIAAPMNISITECLAPLTKALLVCLLPVSLFISFNSVCLPAVIDIRLFYLLISVLFMINALQVSSANEMPFYLISSGDLIKLVWQHPKWPFINTGSIETNLSFLIGSSALSCLLLFVKRRFWRAE